MRKFLRMAALILALTMLFTGCAASEGESEASPSATADTAETLDYPSAASVMEPDTVVMTVAGEDISWAEFYYWMVSSLELTKKEMGALPGWDDDAGGGMTFEEYTMADAARASLLYHVVGSKAAELELGLSDADREELDSIRSQAVEYFGGEEQYQDYLRKNYLTEDLYIYFQEISSLYYGLFVGYFGENGEKCTDEDAIGVVENEGYIRVKAILLDSQEKAQEVADQLTAAGEGYGELFDELIAQYSESSGLESTSGGYLITQSDVEESFAAAAAALDYNEFSGPVETGDGYYIILRLPIDPEIIVDEGYTVRYYAASVLFEDMVSDWADEAEAGAVYAEAYDSISPRAIFGE